MLKHLSTSFCKKCAKTGEGGDALPAPAAYYLRTRAMHSTSMDSHIGSFESYTQVRAGKFGANASA